MSSIVDLNVNELDLVSGIISIMESDFLLSKSLTMS